MNPVAVGRCSKCNRIVLRVFDADGLTVSWSRRRRWDDGWRDEWSTPEPLAEAAEPMLIAGSDRQVSTVGAAGVTVTCSHDGTTVRFAPDAVRAAAVTFDGTKPAVIPHPRA